MRIESSVVNKSPLGKLLLVALIGGLMVGCGGKDGAGSITGKVTFEGKPVTVGTVRFSGHHSGAASQNNLDEEGAYSLVIPDSGLPAGDYTVTIAPVISYKSGEHGMQTVYQGQESIPVQYHKPKNSPLKATLADGNNTFDFDMVQPKKTKKKKKR